MIGSTIKDFKLVRRLGKGGMGEVWEAEQQVIHTRVAIKLLLAELSADKQHVQRFFNEAIAVSKIQHAGIVRIYDVGFHEARAYLIMEFLDGETLAARISRAGRLPVGQAAEVVRQMAGILAATHATGITHRDLKPENIFLVADRELASGERVKIVDFGIAKLATGMNSTGLTATGGSMGTPAYMAPEQWHDAAKADARADVYSLGCVAFEVLSGKPPFEATSIAEACTKHLTVTAPRIRQRQPDVPSEVDALISRMLTKQPTDRPAVAEIISTFQRVASMLPLGNALTLPPSGSGLSSSGNTTLRNASGARTSAERLPRRGVWLGLAAVGVGSGLTAYLATRGGNDPKPGPQLAAGVASAPPPQTHQQAATPADPNPFISIVPPTTPIVLGIDDEQLDASQRGFRPSRHITSPTTPYQLQRHEVTWSEFGPFLTATKTSVDKPPWGTADGLPATGMTWATALAYCRSIGALLPTEEQWEYAARGRDRRPAPWGSGQLDRALTYVYAGSGAQPIPVETSVQDVTPEGIHDLIGNVREWTLDLWREDVGGHDDTYTGLTTVRAVRGLPLAEARPSVPELVPAAYRASLCSTGPCADKGRELRWYVGLRCAK